MSLPPPKDNYAGEPEYPAPWTTGRPKEGLRDIGEARIICLAPDVCLTPVGNSVVPIPYQIVDYCGDDQGYTPSVRFTGKKAMVLRSSTTCVHGDAPGTRKGVKSGTVEDICEPIGHAPEVRAEGSNVIRHLDRFHMNCKNTVGEAIFVRDTATYQAPEDNDPVPGSLALSKPIQLAFDTSSPEAQQMLRELMQQSAKRAAPAAGGEALGGVLLRRFGIWGAVIYEGYRLGQEENQRAWSDPLSYMEREAERYGGVKNFDAEEFELFDRAVRDLKDGVPQGFVRDDFYRQMHQYQSQR